MTSSTRERDDVAALRRANEDLAHILDGSADGFFHVDSRWRCTYLNRKAGETFAALGKSPRDVIGHEFWNVFPELVGTEFEHAYRRAATERTTVEIEACYQPLGRWFTTRAFPSSDGLCVHFKDVTRRKHAEEALASENAVLDLIVSGASQAEVLERLARDAEVQSGEGMICSVLLLDPDGERLVHGAGPSLPDAYNEAIHGVRIGPSVGSCGTAAHLKRAVRVTDIANDPLWADYKDLAALHGLAACSSTPVLSSRGELLGTVAMYFREPRAPSEREEQVIALTTRLASIVIERTRSEAALKAGADRLRATFEQVAVGVAVAGMDGRFVEMNRKFCEILGYSEAELRALTFRDITHPDDLAMTEASVTELIQGRIRDYSVEKRYRRRGGTDVWCLTTVTLLRDAAGNAQRFLGVIEDITRRRETQEALRRSEQFSRSVIESSRDCIKTLDLDGTLLWISETGQRAICVDDASTIVGKSWIEFWQGEDREGARAAVAAAAQGRTGSFVGQFEVQGEPRWWDVVITPVLGAEGRPEQLLAISRDVTERVAGERKRRESEEQLRDLANSIPQLAWMAEPDGHIFWYNQRWYDYTGTTLEQMQGWGWRSVHDPEILPSVIERWNDSLAHGTAFEMEFPLRGADGVFRWFLTRVNPLRDAAGRVIRWFGTNTDVDQVKRIRHDLEEQTRFLELLNAAGASLASSLDLQAILQKVTDAATQMSGARFGAFFYNVMDEQGGALMLYTLSGASREQFEKFGHPRATPIFAPTFRGERAIRIDDVQLDPRYGQMAPHHGMPPGHLPVRSYLAIPVISRSGEVLGGLFFGHPEPGVFTERAERLVSGVVAQAAVAIDNARLYQSAQKAAEERQHLLESERHARASAEHASRMKDEFLATLSHELRTPLGAILGWAQVLRSRPPTPDDLQRGLETIERNARAQTQLIEDLLDMSRITAGKLRLDVQPVQPAAFIEAAMETVRPAAQAKEVRLECTLDPSAGPVSGDPHRLQQAVWNLLSNAIKFTPKGGRVHVVLRRVDSHVEVSVADTGAGIDPRFLEHVFERFRQADSSTTRQYGGLGLGLAIVKHLVELHGGSVHAHSAGAGQGSTFTVTLPLAPVGARHGAHPRATQADAPAFSAIDLAGLKVLIVDDQADARELVARVLSECNAKVIAADGAEQALRLVESERPDVLVSDIGMPDVDGFELLRRVRALGEERGGKVPAIALTAFARSEDRTRALHRGFLVHVSKPVEPAELAATVASVVGRTFPD